MIINFSLRRWHFLLNHRQVIRIIISSVQQYMCLCKSPWRWLECKHWSLARQKPLILIQNFTTTSKQASKHLHKFFSSCCCTVLIWVNLLKHLNASFKVSKPLSQRSTIMVPSLGSDLGSWPFSASSGALCFLISTRWSSMRSWLW